MSGKLDETGSTKHGDAPGETGQTAPTSPRRRRESRRLRRAEIVYTTALALFAVLAVLAHEYAYFAWDLRLARAIQSIDFPGWAAFMEWTSVFGNGLISWGLTIATALLFFAWRRRSEAAGLALCAWGGSLVNRMFKVLIGRPRPSAELVGFAYGSDEMSFPSGHVMFYVCFFGFLFFAAYTLLPRAARVRRVALALLPLPVI
ncbi:MAG: phosphatase PAP2 family protein, partial [Rubrivivax sp.]|nr:phosphatase PAP2 family protein [Pyrinomonadaceae bacterium]